MKLCSNCKEDNFYFSSSNESKVCKEMNLKYKPSDFTRNFYPNNSDIEIILESDKFEPGCKILYWAAENVPLVHANHINSQKDAYSKSFKNHGMCRVRKDNKISFKISCPQAYKEGKILWPRHIHFVVEKKGKNCWSEGMYTVLCLPVQLDKLTSKRLKYLGVYVSCMQIKKNWKNGDFYMVFAENMDKKGLKHLEEYKDKIYKHLHLDIENINMGKIKKDTPLVIYGNDEKSKRCSQLISRLANMGYENLFYMPEGMKNFSKNSKDLL